MITDGAIARMITDERQRYAAANPRSAALAQAAARHWHRGVPFHWMLDWGTPFPLFVEHAQGAELWDVDGHRYDDFCLGDTGSMFGHSPAPVAQAIARQASRGLTTMLPGEDAVAVADALAARFGLPFWQVTSSASEANRAVIRWCRGITGRSKILVFNGCYHGAVDDVFVDLRDGVPELRKSLVGQVYDVREHTVVVEFNDLPALEAALAGGDIACVLTEPALTNVGMVLPDPGYLQAMRDLCTRHGTLLVFDETHTISSGFGGHTMTHGTLPDLFVLGKPVAGGVPCAVFGFTAEVAQRMERARAEGETGHSGIGTTLSANALALAAMRACLTQVMTPQAYAHMLPLAAELADALRAVIARNGLAWHVTHIGARGEFICGDTAPRNGTQARAAMQGPLEHALHLYLINRGVLIAPFHNMTLISPATTRAQVDRLAQVLDDCLKTLIGNA
ncbi:aspartate aminotransferase family protein [Alteraurantiacibacter buctensis]|uniref:Aminotransferase class III-fold pyridoxal phosphate-dependent enzyme n=1 Tax=Alteraurantiacibacter buctensis TaxID=1503981 RepID=A0A844YVB2_9SPHN|nr:aspartate aminotransferase family protein [Alteraurantiacibacter buctensis]MXO71082.1 aminotransferase class III-fold pyridoxal phosphate-dependent enzyme [Alteraurantiacibacter buctensis]